MVLVTVAESDGCETGVWRDAVMVPGLEALEPGANYNLVGETSPHPAIHFGTPLLNQRLVTLADDFEAHLPGHQLDYADMSLAWGGLFDTESDWSPPHESHRLGTEVDVVKRGGGIRHAYLRSLARSSGFRLLDEDDNRFHLQLRNLPVPLRYLAINAGNASPQFDCWEAKLCHQEDVDSLRDYITTWQPDIIMISEVYRCWQMTGNPADCPPKPSDVPQEEWDSWAPNGPTGPILPEDGSYEFRCGLSVRPNPQRQPAGWNEDGASHEHECVAWKKSRLTYIPGSAKSEYGTPNDRFCHFDFTGFRVRLMLDGTYPITAIAVHPQSGPFPLCRGEQIGRYWSGLVEWPNPGAFTIIGGDWNTDDRDQIQRKPGFEVNYSFGEHYLDVVEHGDERTAVYGPFGFSFDHAFSNFGDPCVNCGRFYGTPSLPYGSTLGCLSRTGEREERCYDDHPRADGGEGMDHRQILVDLTLPR